MPLETVLFILAVVAIAFVILLIPVVLQLWRLLKDAVSLVQTLNQSIPFLLKNLEEITTHVSRSTSIIDEKIQDFVKASSQSLSRMAVIVDHLQYIVPLLLKLPIFRLIKNLFAIAKGLRVFVNVLLNERKDES